MAGAENKPAFDLFSLQASASVQLPNDRIEATLVVEHESRDTAALADKVNNDMAWALAVLDSYENIRRQTGSYNTRPCYEKKRISGWQATQSLILQGHCAENMATALQRLQSRLQIRGMRSVPALSLIHI